VVQRCNATLGCKHSRGQREAINMNHARRCLCPTDPDAVAEIPKVSKLSEHERTGDLSRERQNARTSAV
jgi:hypothetical protein